MPKPKLAQPWPAPDKPRWVSPTEIDRHAGWSPAHRARQTDTPPFRLFGDTLLRSWSAWWDEYFQSRPLAKPAAAPATVTSTPALSEPAPAVPAPSEPPVRRKRGRPRKVPVATTLAAIDIDQP
jgi:hypothetical protein